MIVDTDSSGFKVLLGDGECHDLIGFGSALIGANCGSFCGSHATT